MRPVRATAISRSAAGTNGSTSSRRNARSSATKKDARKSIGSRTRKSATRRWTAAFTPSPRCAWNHRTGSAKATRSKSARRRKPLPQPLPQPFPQRTNPQRSAPPRAKFPRGARCFRLPARRSRLQPRRKSRPPSSRASPRCAAEGENEKT